MNVNRLTAGGQNVATDVKGNITTLPANLRPTGSTTAMNLNWDSDNKLRSADIDANGTADVNFQYDAIGRRVARSGTGGSVVFVQMEQQTIADYPVGGAATTPTFRYVYASYIDEPVVRKTAGTGGTLVYFHRNQQYSITAVTTSAGAVTERYAYTAYGLPTILDASASVPSSSAINNRYTYTGREWDATLGLQHFRARWMSPSAGRFLGRDPIGYSGGKETLYSFCDSKPINREDPSGLASCQVKLVCVTLGGWHEHCGIETTTDNGRTWKRWHVNSPGGGIFSADTCDVQPERITTPLWTNEWRDEGTWDDPTGQLCDCIDSEAANIRNRRLTYFPIPQNGIFYESTVGFGVECKTYFACNSNYSTHCMMKRCGITANRRFAPGWDHRIQKCTKLKPNCWYANKCRCETWENADDDWCSDPPSPPRINPSI
jgi:RHS repeat-associated protein